MKTPNRITHYKHAPCPEDPDPLTNRIDWGARTIVNQDGEVVNIHAEKDRAAMERDRQALAFNGVRQALESTKAREWLRYKVVAEQGVKDAPGPGGVTVWAVEPRKIMAAELDKMVSRDMTDVETPIGKAWLADILADAAARNANRIYWALKELTDMDNRRQI
jgi:hypothetical protein